MEVPFTINSINMEDGVIRIHTRSKEEAAGPGFLLSS